MPLIYNGAKLGGYNVSIVRRQSMRWYILDTDDGVMIVDLEDDPGGLSFGDLRDTGTEIVESLKFSWPS